MNNTMISNKIHNAVNDQINAELWSAYLYLAMAMDAEAKDLPGIANWFFIQWLEEQDHARIFEKYLNSRGARVILKPIDGVPHEWKNPLEMFRDTLEHEQKVTRMINNLAELALEEKDFATLSRLQWFVDEQVEEEESAASQAANFEKAGSDSAMLFRLDCMLGERKYKKAEPLEDK